MEYIWLAYPVLFVLIFLLVAFAELVPKKINIVQPKESEKELHSLIDQLQFDKKHLEKDVKRLHSLLTLEKSQNKQLKRKIKKTNTTPPQSLIINQNSSEALDQAHYEIRKAQNTINEYMDSLRKLEQKVLAYEDIITATKQENKELTQQILLQNQKTIELVEPQKQIKRLMKTFRSQLQELRYENNSLSDLNHRLVEENANLKSTHFI